MRAGCKRRVTDAMIAKLKAWTPQQCSLLCLAIDLDIDVSTARKLKNGHYRHKTTSPQ